ncbi:MAG TPA: hypothetical protein VLC09_19970 [Polyangiaceae bacterium]|nr:hypothetical protein [Polyangiaceae bacterium]
MKLPHRIARLLLGTTAVLGTAAVGCSNDDAGTTDGAGGEAATDSCDRPGESWCTGTASGLSCPEDGGATVAFTCASGDECNDGSCVGQCEPGATDCAGSNTQRTCSADGRQWVIEACQGGFICEEGRCGPGDGKVCIPNSTECVDGSTQRTCKEDGSGWDEVECPGETACSDNACRGTVCAVGATKCDPTADDLLNTMFESSQPNLSVVYTCTDGEHWEATPCSVEDGALEFCMYSGIAPAAVAKYQSEVSAWSTAFAAAMNNDTSPPPTPQPPAIPAHAKASCEPAGCLEQVMYEGPLAMFEGATRTCGKDDDDQESWKSVRECNGVVPYAPAVESVVTCKGQTECSYNYPESGCRAVECRSGEYRCSPDTLNYVEYCNSDGYWSGYNYCPTGEAMPGVCAGSGKYPTRTVTCDGAAYPGVVL